MRQVFPAVAQSGERARNDPKGVIRVGELRILGPNGDTTVTWDPEVEESVEEVRRRFDDIVGRGYLVFALDDATLEGRQVRTFDPEVGRLRAFRPMVGG